jgi:hypothetical protein
MGFIPICPSICQPVHNVFRTFFAMCAAIALKLCTWLYIYDLQFKFEDGCYRPFFGRVMPLELSHFKGFYSFPDFFSQSEQLLHSNFAHGFISMTYRLSSKMVAINQFFSVEHFIRANVSTCVSSF